MQRLLRDSRFRPWRALAALGLCALLLAGLDEWLASAGPRIAFRPPGAQWTAEAADMGAAWRRLEASAAYRNWCAKAGDPIAPFQRSLRHVLGIRPTPLRTRMYLGKAVSVSGGPGGAGFSCQPGVLLRAASALHGLFTETSPEGLRRLGGWAYAWRDGQLIVSWSRRYIREALKAPPYPRETDIEAGELAFRWHAAPRGLCRVRLGGAYPVSGWFEGALGEPPAPLQSLGGWTEPPLAVVSAASLAGLGVLAQTAGAAAGYSTAPEFFGGQWRSLRSLWQLQSLPADWDADLTQAALVFHNIDTSLDVPVPEVSLVLRQEGAPAAAHPLAPLFSAMAPVPMTWADGPGLLVPVAGEPLALCLGRRGSLWLAASRESRMRREVQQALLREETADAAFVHLDWQAIGQAAERILLRCREWGMLARPQPLETDAWTASAGALGQLGVCHLSIRTDQGVSRFEGVLAAGREEP